MLRSSLGFHTMTLTIYLLKPETQDLLKAFKMYSQNTGNIQIYKDKKENTVIKFLHRNQGIEWLIRYNVWVNGFEHFLDIIDVTINPKILGGVQDYITASTFNDMKFAIENFNRISASISPLLGTFDMYTLKRIDYCVNFYLPELTNECTDEQMMKLIKKSNIPSSSSYEKWTKYDTIAHRKKSKPSSFYLMNHSVHINCYSKYMKFEEQSEENKQRGYPPIPQATMDAARGIIRFEIQCMYLKVYNLSQKAKVSGNNEVNKYEYLLSHEVCLEIVNSFWARTVGSGNWYSLEFAIIMIKSHNFNAQKEARLIEALQWVSQCRSVPRAKEMYSGDLKSFNRTLKDLSNLCINPVTIPREWKIDRIWNLLETYHSKVSEMHWCKR